MRPEVGAAVPATLAVSAAATAVVSGGRVEWVNEACAQLLGREPAELAGQPVTRFVRPTADRGNGFAAPTGTGGGLDRLHRIVRPDGEPRWVLATVTAMRPPAPEDASLVQLTDLTAERHAQRQLRHAATHDPVTGLPNRLLFTEHLEHAVARLQRKPGVQVAVLFVDLDRFKHINDTYGHAAGDTLLTSVGERLREAVRPQDVVARLSGDEFAVLLEDIPEPPAACSVASRCLAAISQPHALHGEQLAVTASIGIASTQGTDMQGRELLTAADVAMYRAKENGRGRVEVLTEPLAHMTPAAVLERQLSRALERNELEVHYQPIVDLGSGRVVAGEALLRWRHPEHGLLPAGRFISIAEEAGLIGPIGDWVTEVVCADLRRWDDRGDSVEHAYVNIAAQQIRDGFVEHVAGSLDAHDIAPHRLRLEITETELMSTARSLEHLDAVHRLGCSLVVDDFGTGYSSLSRLIDLPIDVVKIDHSFISGLGLDPRPTAVVSAALLLANDLRQGVIAEGVETEEQRRWLSNAGCAYAQGFGIAYPVPAAEFPPPLRMEPIS